MLINISKRRLMDFQLFTHLNNYSLHTDLLRESNDDEKDINIKKTERLVTKDIEWSEVHTITTAGYIHNKTRFGFDGYDEVNNVFCEAKSSNLIINKEAIVKLDSDNKIIGNRIDGRGIFSLFTHKSYNRYSSCDVNMLISSYINGVLMFIIEFPFNDTTFKNHIKTSLDKKLPNRDESEKSKTISFGYNQYKDCKDAKLVYFTKKNRKILKGASTKNFYNYLIKLSES